MPELTFQELTTRFIEAQMRRDNPPDSRKQIIGDAMLMAHDVHKAFKDAEDSVAEKAGNRS